ncbi:MULTISPECIES: NAD(P)H-binding protein [Streptomyces]|uniref:NAD(P)H-binding protein n=1 Tax=Streptomyces doebereineriae TaxID=3075528 RepID=A0ABU2VG86_9ACTN|nr:NAD(P)H-binding protein [Streptomyces sp. DSM 41640]MDT0484586.1 NAD(P)H-binding protein [Streptomyces sp. DSM 41640]
MARVRLAGTGTPCSRPSGRPGRGRCLLSALGPRNPRADAGITSRGTRAIVAAMQPEHVRRIIIVSAAPVGPVPLPGRPTPPRHDPGDGFFMRHLGVPLTRAMFGRHYADLAVTEQILRDSGRQWTVSRPPKRGSCPRRPNRPGPEHSGRPRTAGAGPPAHPG